LNDSKKKAILMTILAGFLWGTSFPAIKIGLQFMDAYTFVFLRFLVASIASLVVALLTKSLSFEFGNKRLVLFLGLSNGIAYLLQYVGMVSVAASESSLFVNLSAVWVAILSTLVLKERLGYKKWFGVTMSFVGVVLITTNLDFVAIGKSNIIPNFLVISSGILWAVFTVYSKPMVRESKNIIKSMNWLMLFTMLPLLPIGPFSAGTFILLPWNAWLAILYTALFCWVIPYYLWLRGLKHISSVTSSVVLLTEIVVAVSISTIFLGEALTVTSSFGAIFIIVAMLLVSQADQSEKNASTIA